MTKSSSTYGEVLRSSSVMGGALAAQYLVAILRTKAVALLLGPTGVGLVGVYLAVTTAVGTIAGLGIQSSGVRDVAEADASGDAPRISRTIRTLRRASWATGGAGWLLLVAFAWPLSEWTFGSTSEAVNLAILGATVLLTSLDTGEGAIVQGTRRIDDFARRVVVQGVLATVVAIAGYGWLGERGIVPVLIATAATNYAASWWFSSRIVLAPVVLTWRATWDQTRQLIGMGLAFMWSALLAAGTSLAIRALIVRDVGMDASGMYQAAWALSGMFAAFILSAMGSDFYPRLTAVAADHEAVNRMVNQQTEVGLLLALPGLLGTLAFAPWVMRAFYSSEFAPGTELLPWFVIGVSGRVVSWPMGYILLAKGASRWFAFMETTSAALHLALAFGLLHGLGLVGVAVAFGIYCFAYMAAMFALARHITGFGWSAATVRLLLASTALTAICFAVQQWFDDAVSMVVGGALTLAAGLLSVRGIASRLGPTHRIVRLACTLPGGRLICGLRDSAGTHG